MTGRPRAAEAIDALRARGLTVGTGESLTAGLLSAAFAEVPGCSDVLQGGVVAYQTSVKRSRLGVPGTALARGAVSESVALAMARGARRALGADVGVSTTGVAGPDPHDGAPVGAVWIAVATPQANRALELALTGDRASIRSQTVDACLDLLLEVLSELPDPPELPALPDVDAAGPGE